MKQYKVYDQETEEDVNAETRERTLDWQTELDEETATFALNAMKDRDPNAANAGTDTISRQAGEPAQKKRRTSSGTPKPEIKNKAKNKMEKFSQEILTMMNNAKVSKCKLKDVSFSCDLVREIEKSLATLDTSFHTIMEKVGQLKAEDEQEEDAYDDLTDPIKAEMNKMQELQDHATRMLGGVPKRKPKAKAKAGSA